MGGKISSGKRDKFLFKFRHFLPSTIFLDENCPQWKFFPVKNFTCRTHFSKQKLKLMCRSPFRNDISILNMVNKKNLCKLRFHYCRWIFSRLWESCCCLLSFHFWMDRLCRRNCDRFLTQPSPNDWCIGIINRIHFREVMMLAWSI